MTHYITGDLLTSDCDVLVHQCNCWGTFGAGIARQIKEQYPEAYYSDQCTLRGDKTKLGTAVFVHSQGKIIVNLYGQYDHGGYGRDGVYVDYKALRRGLQAVHDACAKPSSQWPTWPKIGMPRIGCALAGGSWARVAKILDDVFGTRPVYIYTLEGDTSWKE